MLIDVYNNAINCGDICDDVLQRQIINYLQQLSDSLQTTKNHWWSWDKQSVLKGIYLYGSVGVGKTFLMDLFFDHLLISAKKRFHFHHFMQQIDAQLRQLQGQKNPLKIIAKQLADSTKILCFDEFMVNDVADAMILADLLQALFKQGLVLVATSNTRPDDLYLTGVQRPRFLPAITAINNYCHVLSLDNKCDYRLNREPKLETYLMPLNDETLQQLTHQFDSLTGFKPTQTQLQIQHRDICCIKWVGRVVWFDFKTICNLPRSQLDYLEISTRFDTIFVSNIPALSENDTVFVILLAHFIDVMYDRGIRLIVSAAVPPNELYVKGDMVTTFKRTLSRLEEMQSIDYLKRHPHDSAHKNG
jgi:cell division protein ZapE